jgi:hypothetical protein
MAEEKTQKQKNIDHAKEALQWAKDNPNEPGSAEAISSLGNALKFIEETEEKE